MKNEDIGRGVPSQTPARSYRRFLCELIHTRTWLVFLSRLLLFVGFFCFVPHFQTEITEFFARRHSEEEIECTGHKADDENDSDACKEAHNDVILYTTIRTIFSAVFVRLFLTPAVGTWSDIYGRKTFLIFSLILHLVPAIVVLLYVKKGLPLYWYYPAYVVADLFDGSPLVLAYVSDVIPDEHRILAFALSSMMISLGGIFGTALTLSGTVGDINTAALVLGGACILSALITLIFVPESLSKEHRASAKAQLHNTARELSMIEFVKFTWESFCHAMRILLRYKFFRRLAIILFLVCIVAEEYMEYTVQYLQEVLGFGTAEQALMRLLQSLFGLFLMTVGTYLLVIIFKVSEKRLVICGLTFIGAGIGLLAIVQTAWMAYMSGCFIAFWMILSMAVSSMKAKYVDPHEQGAVQGALSAITALGFGIGPVIFMAIFLCFRNDYIYLPAAPYYFGFALMIIAFLIALSVQLPKESELNAQLKNRVKMDEIDAEAQEPLIRSSIDLS